MYLVTADEMQRMDRKTIETFGLPGRVLMENAGRGATRILLRNFKGLLTKKVGVVAGRGNNGGDGFVIARCLVRSGISVNVYLLAKSETVRGDAAENLKLLAPMGITVHEIPDPEAFNRHKTAMRTLDVWVDAVLGTGLKSNVKGFFKQVIEFINGLNRPIFSVDVPSGLNADTGQPCGACIRADITATFAFAKTGHLVYPGADYTGKLEIVDIGIPAHIVEDVGPKQFLLTADVFRADFKPRPPDTHKGQTGHLLVIAGSPGKTGAAAMTAMSAMRTGAGLVTLGIPKSLSPVLEAQVLEAMTAALPETVDGMFADSAFDKIMDLLSGKKCMVLGPGLGVTEEIQDLVCRILQSAEVPVVIDADGLNNLAACTQILKALPVPIILTPHPGEMARLTGTPVRHIQEDRITCARDFAETYNVHVILKGARTVIAHPDGKVYVCPTGNPGMASGGMGDVLTGVVAGLITQGYAVEAAAHMAVYLHGAAADQLAETAGPIGFLATDVMNAIPGQIKKLGCCNPQPSDSNR